VVMTAGHCMGGITRVRIGTNDYASGGEFIRVVSEHEYPNSWTTVDVGVLVLEEESSFEPRTIAQDCVLDDLHDGAQVQIVGFGAVDIWGNQYTNHLMEARTTVNDHDCSDLWSGCNGSVSPGGEISAGGGGVDACYGDSGGPLYLLTDKGDYLVGITSRSYANVWAPCEEGGIYGRPDYVVDWVESVTGRTLPEPDCGQEEDEGGTEGGSTDEGSQSEGESGEDILLVEAPVLIVPEGSSAWSRLSVSRIDGLPPGPVSFSIVRSPDEGEAEIAEDGVLRFSAPAGFIGDDSLVVLVSDGSGNEAVALVDVVVAEREAESTGGCAIGESGLGLAPLSSTVIILFGVGWRRRANAEPRRSPPSPSPSERGAHRLPAAQYWCCNSCRTRSSR
jgi:hypothetical protein